MKSNSAGRRGIFAFCKGSECLSIEGVGRPYHADNVACGLVGGAGAERMGISDVPVKELGL